MYEAYSRCGSKCSQIEPALKLEREAGAVEFGWEAEALGRVPTYRNISALFIPYIRRDIHERSTLGEAARVGG